MDSLDGFDQCPHCCNFVELDLQELEFGQEAMCYGGPAPCYRTWETDKEGQSDW